MDRQENIKATERSMAMGYEERFVILETKVGDCFETVLPKTVSVELAKKLARMKWEAVRKNQVKTLIELAVMGYDEDSDELNYSSYDLIDYLRG